MARGAIVLLDPEILPEAVRLITDHGLEIVCTLDGREDVILGRSCALVVTGDALPEECASASPARVVTFTATTEAYGSQRLTRVSQILVDELATQRLERRRRREAV